MRDTITHIKWSEISTNNPGIVKTKAFVSVPVDMLSLDRCSIAVYMVISAIADKSNKATISNASIAILCGYNRRSVINSIKLLIENGYIGKKENGITRENTYTILQP